MAHYIRRPGWIRWLGWILAVAAAALVAIQLWYAGHILWWRDHPVGETSFMSYRMDELRSKNPKAQLRYQWVPYDRISNNLKRAMVAAEDAKFIDDLGAEGGGQPHRLDPLLAAPVDHVHPAAAGSSAYSAMVSDPSEQSQSGPDETVIAQFPVDFSPTTPNLIPTFEAIVDVDSGTATFNVRLSVTPDVVDGAILATITKTAEGGAELRSAVGPSFVPLTVPALIKITAANDNAAVSCRIRSKTVTLRTA